MDGTENSKRRGINMETNKRNRDISMLRKINQLINTPIIAFILGYVIGLVNALFVLSK